MSASGSDVEDEDGMAAFMGFSTFGKAPAAKKRKFNPATDSFVAEDDLKNLDRGGKKGRGSGGNNIPLGKSRVIGMKQSNLNDMGMVSGEGEMGKIRNLGAGIGAGMNLPPPRASYSPARDEHELAEEDGPRYIDTSLPPPRSMYQEGERKQDEEEDDEGPRYMDTSLPPPIESDRPAHTDTSLSLPGADAVSEAEAAEMQERIDRIMAAIKPPPGLEEYPPPPPPASIPFMPAPFQLRQNPMEISGLPARPPGSFGSREDRGGERGGGTSHSGSQASGGRQRGERNQDWYLGYYDPAFNENPWEMLEKKNGIESWGTWVTRTKG